MQYWRRKNPLPREQTEEISIPNPHPPLAAGARVGRMKQNSFFFPFRKYMMTTSLLKYLPYWAQVELLAEQDRPSTRLLWQSKTNYFWTDVSAQTSFFTLDRWGNSYVKWAATKQKQTSLVFINCLVSCCSINSYYHPGDQIWYMNWQKSSARGKNREILWFPYFSFLSLNQNL